MLSNISKIHQIKDGVVLSKEIIKILSLIQTTTTTMSASLFTFGSINSGPSEPQNSGIAPELTLLQGNLSGSTQIGDQTSMRVDTAPLLQVETGISSQNQSQYLPWGYGVPWSFDKRLEMVIHRKDCVPCMQYHSHVSGADLEQPQSYLDAVEVRHTHFQSQFASKGSKPEDVNALLERIDRRDRRIADLKDDLSAADDQIKELSDEVQQYKQEIARLEDLLSLKEDNGRDRKRARKLPAVQTDQSARIDEDVEMAAPEAAPSTYAGVVAKPADAPKSAKTAVAYIHIPDKESVERNAALNLPKPLGIPQTITYKWVRKLFAEANEPNNEDALAFAKVLAHPHC